MKDKSYGIILDRLEDFQALGISPDRAEVWEDAARQQHTRVGEYEWWYVDGHFSNGMMVVTSFFINSDSRGNPIPGIRFNLSDNNNVYTSQSISFPSRLLSVSKSKADVSIGSSYFRSTDGLNTFEIYLD